MKTRGAEALKRRRTIAYDNLCYRLLGPRSPAYFIHKIEQDLDNNTTNLIGVLLELRQLEFALNVPADKRVLDEAEKRAKIALKRIKASRAAT